MTYFDEPQVDVTSKANRHFIAQESSDYACNRAVVRDQRGLSGPHDVALRMIFEVTPYEAAKISRALRSVDYKMNSSELGRFDVELEGGINVATGLGVLFKRMSDGSFQGDNTGARPLVSKAMQGVIIEKLNGLLITPQMARDNLDDDQKAPVPALPEYD